MERASDETQVPLLTPPSSSSVHKVDGKATAAAATTTAAAATPTKGASNPDTSRTLDLGRTRVGIIGTGNYAVALTKRLTLVAGCDVTLGSRKPEQRRATLASTRDCMCGVQLASVAACVQNNDLIFVAIHREDFRSTLAPFAQQLAGKIVVDVSNREYRYAALSNAEYLASILPGALVVKAFNSVSAFAMEDMGDSGFASSASRVVYVAGNDPAARAKVTALAQTMGFRVMDIGPLSSARWMEDFVLKVFTHWKIPIFLAFGIFNLWSLYIVYIYWIDRPDPAYSWEQIFLKVINKPLCMTAITMLALTYLPGQIASVLQVWRGTKHRRFPQLLDTWLKSRKQLGLVAFFLASLHAVASVLMLSPTYYSSWFHKVTVTLPANATLTSDLVLTPSKAWMTWKGEAACALGVLAFVLMVIVALTSIRSVGESLNWSEWRCIHSQLSYAVLALSAAHVCVMGGPGWKKKGFPDMMRSITFLSAILPLLVLLLKLVFSLPPLSGHLRRIRRGWERSPAELDNDAEKSAGNGCLASLRDSICCCGKTSSSPRSYQAGGGAGVRLVVEEVSSENIRCGRDRGNPSTCCGGSGRLGCGTSRVKTKGAINSIFTASHKSDTSRDEPHNGAKDIGGKASPLANVQVSTTAADCHLTHGVSLHKDCTCAQQTTNQVAFPQGALCQCSSV